MAHSLVSWFQPCAYPCLSLYNLDQPTSAISLLGVILVQAWAYFNNNNDRWDLRALVNFFPFTIYVVLSAQTGQVASLVIMDIVITVMNSVEMHYVQISNFGDLIALQSKKPFSYQMSTVVVTVMITFLVQIFFATRVLVLNRVHRVVPLFIILCAIGACVPGMMVGVGGLVHWDLQVLTTTKAKIQLGLYCGFAALGDLAVTVALLWSFRHSRTGFKKTDGLLQKLLQYTVTRGVLMTLLQSCLLIVYLSQPGSLSWTALYYCESKLYVITMLAMLNSRASLRGDNPAVVTVSSGAIQTTQSGTNPSQDTAGSSTNDLEAGYVLKSFTPRNPNFDEDYRAGIEPAEKSQIPNNLWKTSAHGVLNITRE
ncbi:hypothetical protein Moror_8199 [Moniliophthora roreri MCA 2997]|uniref:DUF6534 domain-containing protein n=1 Tax=Moniliophthora roreri (strain MCA 2997) TaxID=1381753 RepID=V2YRP0_MONRO|nr:hypothetical protein Moror_8199 [Moniliophthora roreri MCA 2997]